jgi:hypothetical protein
VGEPNKEEGLSLRRATTGTDTVPKSNDAHTDVNNGLVEKPPDESFIAITESDSDSDSDSELE